MNDARPKSKEGRSVKHEIQHLFRDRGAPFIFRSHHLTSSSSFLVSPTHGGEGNGEEEEEEEEVRFV